MLVSMSTSTPETPARPRPRRAWRRRRAALLLATVAAAGVGLPQAVPSLAQERALAPVDPDCPHDPEDPVLQQEQDGVCPQASSMPETPKPPPPPQPPATPSPPQTTPPAQPAPAPTEPAQSDAVVDENGTPRRATRGGPNPPRSKRRSVGRARQQRQGRRRHARRIRQRAGHGRPRAHRRRGARRRQAARRSTLGPIPRWARSVPSRPLPDPLPAGRRLDPGFARALKGAAARHGVRWELVLAALRAEGGKGASPADRGALDGMARRLAHAGARRNPRAALRALSGFGGPAVVGLGNSAEFSERVLALAAYNRAVSLSGLVRGLDAVKARLEERVLASPRLMIYPGGRADIEDGRIDGRVLFLLLYLADRHGSVTVSSLQTGHSFLTRSGNVSNHSLGRAVDIAALGGTPIIGHQESGGVTERGLRSVMLLPREMWPSELISLFELGGPSFAMADHADHIHIGF